MQPARISAREAAQMSQKHVGPDSHTRFPREKKQTNHLLFIPANSSCQLMSRNGGCREMSKVLPAIGLSTAPPNLVERLPAQQSRTFLEKVCITANSHKCDRVSMNFQLIAPTASFPASRDILSALLMKIKCLKCSSIIF